MHSSFVLCTKREEENILQAKTHNLTQNNVTHNTFEHLN